MIVRSGNDMSDALTIKKGENTMEFITKQITLAYYCDKLKCGEKVNCYVCGKPIKNIIGIHDNKPICRDCLTKIEEDDTNEEKE